MSGIHTRVNVAGATAALEGIAARIPDALETLTRKVEADMRPFVKHDTGALESSALLNSDFRGGTIRYTATRGHGEYAGYAYDDPNVAATDHNPKATAHWDEAARAERSEEWARVYVDALTGGA